MQINNLHFLKILSSLIEAIWCTIRSALKNVSPSQLHHFRVGILGILFNVAACLFSVMSIDCSLPITSHLCWCVVLKWQHFIHLYDSALFLMDTWAPLCCTQSLTCLEIVYIQHKCYFFLSLVYLNGKNTVCTPTTSLKLDPTAPSGFKLFKVSELHSE